MKNVVSPSAIGLLSYYNFDEGTAGGNNAGITTLYDQTSNGNNGTLNNFALTGSTSNWVESYAMVVPVTTAATSTSSTSFTANWTAPLVGTVDNYLLDVSTSSSFSSFVTGYNSLNVGNVLTYNVTGLSASTTYYYRVRANKASVTGQGGYSNTTTTATSAAPVAPTVTTTTATSITSTTASSGGTVTSNGGSAITAEGVAYGTSTAPTTGTSDGTATPFTSSLTGLTPGTTYYYRAYATNSVGTSYGTEMSFTTSAPPVITYYPKTSATDLSRTISWTDDATGTAGTSPVDFTSANQQFNITRNPFVLSPWAISGGSNVILSVTGLTFRQFSSLTVGSGSNFDFGGNNNYNTTFKSVRANTASLLQVSGTISNATNVTVERFISSLNNRAYRLLTPSVNTATSTKPFIRDNWQEGVNNPNTATILNPVPTYGTQITGSQVGANGFDATATGQGSLFMYDQTTPAWLPATNTDATNMFAKTGLLVYIRGDRSIDLNSTASTLPSTNTTLRATGTLLTGTQTFTGLASNGNFSLVTDPYASAINWGTIYTNNSGSFENYYTYWDPNIGTRGGYVTVRNDGMQSPNTSPTPANYPGVNIQSGQAFFVKTLSGINTPTLTIQEADKSTVNNIDVFRTATPASQKFTTSFYYNDAEHGRRLADGVTSLYDDTYNKALDGNDAEEINNWDENIAIARAGKHLSIEERPTIATNDTLALFMNNMKQQTYEFEFNPSGLNPNTIAVLMDNYTGGKTYLDVTTKTVVPFNVTSAAGSSATDRFYILFKTSGALPVTLTSVKAYQKNTGVQVEWTTQQENNIDHYEVERSQNGQQFTKTGAVNATGNTSSITNYNLFDANPFSGVNFYRIKIIDKQGNATYSQVVKVNISSKANQVTVTPNPIHSNTVMIQMTNMQKGSYTISLTNKLGQQIAVKVIDHAGGSSLETITPAKAFANGVYQLKVTGNGISVIQQVLKN
jgi:hypothetical protein